MEHPKTGLIPPKKDIRTFSYKKFFGAPLPIDVPDFQIGTPRIKNQGQDGSCVAFAITSVSEDQEGVELEPAYQWFKDKQKDGGNLRGTDPDNACNTIIKIGSIEKSVSPLHLPDDGGFNVSLPNNWTNLPVLDLDARVHKKKSWFDLLAGDGGNHFDAIRQIMYQDKVSVLAGVYWQSIWTYTPTGICAFYGKDRSLPHAVKIFGQKTILGTPYLMVQNSWGELGDSGVYYFSREVVNELVFARGFFDISPEDVKNAQWSLLSWLKDWLIKLFSETKQPPITPPEPPKPVEPIVPQIPAFAEGIFEAEGNGKQAGMALNNRGDLKYSAYTKSLGAIGSGFNNFAVFRTMEDGDNACRQLLTDACSNKLLGYHGATLNQFCERYGNPPVLSNYVSVVLKHLPGRTGSTLIKDLL